MGKECKSLVVGMICAFGIIIVLCVGIAIGLSCDIYFKMYMLKYLFLCILILSICLTVIVCKYMVITKDEEKKKYDDKVVEIIANTYEKIFNSDAISSTEETSEDDVE